MQKSPEIICVAHLWIFSTSASMLGRSEYWHEHNGVCSTGLPLSCKPRTRAHACPTTHLIDSLVFVQVW